MFYWHGVKSDINNQSFGTTKVVSGYGYDNTLRTTESSSFTRANEYSFSLSCSYGRCTQTGSPGFNHCISSFVILRLLFVLKYIVRGPAMLNDNGF